MSNRQQQQQPLQQIFRASALEAPRPNPFGHKKSFETGYWRCGVCDAWLHPQMDADKIAWGNSGKNKDTLAFRYHITCKIRCIGTKSRIRYHVRGAATRKRKGLTVPRY